jgi:uncharacterized protein YukE
MRTKYTKSDDVALARDVKNLQRQIAKLTEWHSDLSKRFFAHTERMLQQIEILHRKMEQIKNER